MAGEGSDLTRRELIGGAAAMAGAGLVTAGGDRVVIEGVGPYQVYDPLFECVRVALARRGEKHTAAYLQGISGAGFRIGGPCPCAPTCVAAMTAKQLAELLGYECEELGFDAKADVRARLAEVLPRIKAEVRAGRPVVVFHAFTTAEWDVVCGYDDATHEFLGRGGYQNMLGKDYARAPQDRMTTCGDICPIGGAMLIGRKVGRFDARKAEVAALREAVRHARDGSRRDYPYDGLAVYAKWLECWAARDAKPEWGRDGYTTAVYSSTHAAGAGFLRQVRGRSGAAGQALERAAQHLEREAGSLHEMLALLFPPKDRPPVDVAAARSRVPLLLTRARDHYASMADCLSEALREMPATA